MIDSLTNRTGLTESRLYVPRHKIGYFGHVPQVNLLAWYGKTKPNIKSTHSPIKRNVLQHKKN